MKASGKVLKKDRVYKIKSKKLTRICNYFLIRWNKFILLKSIEPTTKSINQILLIRHFFDEHKSEIARYETDLAELKTSYSKLPDSKDILDKLDTLQEKKNTLMQEYSSTKSTMDELYQIRKNYGIYMGKEMER